MVRDTRMLAAARRRLTADEYERMGRAGILHEDDPVELIDGELMQMAAKGGPHVTCVNHLNYWFVPRLVDRAIVSVQNSFRLSDFSEPEPDLVLLRYREDMYGDRLPRTEDVLLIIEVADSSLRYDRSVKLPRYAAAGIPEVWIVQIRGQRVSVYRDPTPDGYRQVIAQTRGSVLSPLAFPDLELRSPDIFGRS